ncbi:hypothetical protein F5Y08DRAFT_346519 [Xylaria arbuscula]|nr:hypothetical protein F5Y08DRAFT_346519 [Xylaria arbuscula]
MTTEEQHDVESDAKWLLDELERYPRRPPWYSEPEPDNYGIIDPIFKRDDLFHLVYRAARRRARGATRFNGQAKLRRNIEKLNSAPSEHKEAVVTNLLDTISPERRHEVQLWQNEKGRRKKKRPAHSCDEFVSPPRTPSLETAATRTSQAIDDTPNTPLVHQSPGATDNSFTMQASICVGTSRQTNDPEHSFSTTLVAKAKAVLHGPLFRVLERSYSHEHETFVAHIGMSYENADNCQLNLEINSGKVESYAETLFDTHLETRDGLRYITLGNTRILPNPKATISGCKTSAIASCFGQLLDSAVRESPLYKEDTTALFSDHTRAVSMVVSQNANDAGLLVLHTNLLTCVDIWARLY